jgi:hypothetical protein
MDATIVAALISGGVGAIGIVGTVVTSVVGSKNTREATGRTVEAGTAQNRATLIAAREDRLWERRAAAYEEALTGLLHRQAKRHFDTRQFRTSDEQQMKEFYESYQLPGVFETESRLVAYASDSVMKAYRATRGAHAAVVVAYSHRAALQESNRLAGQTGRQEGAASPEIMTDAQRKLDIALREADAADDTLIEVIRDELRSKPEAAMVPAEVPARHRGFWHRRKAVED